MRWFVRFTAVGAVALLIWPFLRTSVGDGYYSLSVDIRSSEIPNRVYCEAVGRPMHAEFVLESPWPTSASVGATLADPFQGAPLIVRVPCSDRSLPFGIVTSRTQFRCLVVRAVFSDGKEQHQIIKIPDRMVTRQVTVTFP
jgi:hypothetical protein